MDFHKLILRDRVKSTIFSFFLWLDITSPITSQYSSVLTNSSEQFCHVGDCSDSAYYYQVFRLNISITGYYSLKWIGNMDAFRYLYNNSFVPPAPSQNVVASNHDSGDNQQFHLYIWLDSVTTYYLVVTTNNPIVTGQYTVIAMGLASVTFSPMNTSGKSPIYFRVLL